MARSRTSAQIEAEEKALKAEFGELYRKVESILFHHDPIGINFGINTDEYSPEVGTILPRLKECDSAADVAAVVYQELLEWFDPVDVGSQAKYTAPAQEIWEAWLAFCESRRNG